MAARDMQAAKSAIVAGLMATGVPAQTASLMADQQILAHTVGAKSDKVVSPGPALLFGVPWYFVAIGGAITVILLARR